MNNDICTGCRRLDECLSLTDQAFDKQKTLCTNACNEQCTVCGAARQGEEWAFRQGHHYCPTCYKNLPGLTETPITDTIIKDKDKPTNKKSR